MSDQKKRDNKIEQIKKLLAASHDTANGNEAAVAAQMAQRLMIKHAISMADLDEHERSVIDPLGESAIKVGNTGWAINLAWVLGSHCNVSVLRCGRWNGVFAQAYGHQSDIEIWQYLYSIARKEVERLTKEYRKHPDVQQWCWRKEKYIVDRKLTSQYRTGLVMGLQSKLNEQKREATVVNTEATALVLQDRAKVAEQYMRSKNGRVGTWSSSVGGSNQGYRDGKKISLNAGLNGSRAPRQIGGGQ
tara:strand:- start:107 stop:844 length:738 start_codon:yes stop_codon:yes gene_type:complete